MKRSLVLCLTVIGMMSALVSCKKNVPENVAALVNQDYIPAGLVISYKADVDKASVNPASYSVKGREIGSVFVSKSNPFSKETAADGKSFVVVLLKEGDNSSDDGKIDFKMIKTVPDIAVKQVRDIKTVNGKTLPSWKGEFKATESYPVTGGFTK